ncbi:hypothetical protein ABTZ03_35310 [Kitasatospora sp. NPDC096077]
MRKAVGHRDSLGERAAVIQRISGPWTLTIRQIGRPERTVPDR